MAQPNKEYIQILQNFLQKVQQMDQMLSELTRDLLDVKEKVPYELSKFINTAISGLGGMHRGMSGVRGDIGMAVNPPQQNQGNNRGNSNNRRRRRYESLNESELDMMTRTLVEYGYDRNMAADKGQIWYSHPFGHQIAATPKSNTFSWTYFPPRMMWEMVKGLGLQKLNDQLTSAHRHDPQIQEATEPVREFLVQQTEESPIEQYRLWEKGEEYPTIVSKDPKTGMWRCLTCAGNSVESKDSDRHVQVVKRWVLNGKPAPADQQYSGYERPGFQNTNSPIGLMDLNPTRKS